MRGSAELLAYGESQSDYISGLKSSVPSNAQATYRRGQQSCWRTESLRVTLIALDMRSCQAACHRHCPHSIWSA